MYSLVLSLSHTHTCTYTHTHTYICRYLLGRAVSQHRFLSFFSPPSRAAISPRSGPQYILFNSKFPSDFFLSFFPTHPSTHSFRGSCDIMQISTATTPIPAVTVVLLPCISLYAGAHTYFHPLHHPPTHSSSSSPKNGFYDVLSSRRYLLRLVFSCDCCCCCFRGNKRCGK